ncbi:AAA family ATPase [Streptomyces sp. NPDC046821]|uniref:helix-turn-helix transcriptional regulator n=1 Tax=Streptomyces sp. NPDC046821 TaxID=3154702 RepID=UPI0033E36D06
MSAGLMGRQAERAALSQFVEAVRRGEGRAMVVRGEAGVGKTVLVDDLARLASGSGCQVIRAVGVQSEMELAFAGLHQLCAPVLDQVKGIPGPQDHALRTAFGLADGPPPDRFLVGLGVLSLLSELAGERPVICVVDDEQWLDRASVQALGFAARRLAADRVGLLFAAREPGAELVGLPELEIGGLPADDARALLATALAGPLDERVRELIIAETRGNPLALLELPRGLSQAELAGGFGLPGVTSLAGRIEDSFTRRLATLPAPTRQMLLVAAADPSGDRALVWRAARRLGIPVQHADAAVQAGLVEFGLLVRFRHPLVRSAVYQSARESDRRAAHAALAEVTDPELDPDRRAWHRAQAADGPDEDVAAELESSAGRAQARGGMAAAAAFLERSVLLTADPVRHTERALAAAQVNMQAGAFGQVLELLDRADAASLDEFQQARAELLRANVAFASGLGNGTAELLLKAGRLLEPFDLNLTRETYLSAMGAAFVTGQLSERGVLSEICRAAEALPVSPGEPRPLDLLLHGHAVLIMDGHAAAVPIMKQAAKVLTGIPVEDVLRWGWMATNAHPIVWDFEGFRGICERQVRLVREAGALAQLPLYLNQLGIVCPWMGDLAGTAALVAETESVATAIGSPIAPFTLMRLQTLQGREAEASAPITSAIEQSAAGGQGIATAWAHWMAAVLYNGLGRYEEAASVAGLAVTESLDPHFMAIWPLPELVEAAALSGDLESAGRAMERLTASTRPAGTDWALGIEARCRALLSDGADAEDLYTTAITCLGQTEVRPELARAHLLYGEWLRRARRRTDSRAQLRTAHRLFEEMGMEAFATRAARELRATGATVTKRAVTAPSTLTAQEATIARLARDGHSNPEIGTQLFLSARTVEWHLRKVFTKLGIGSRNELRAALVRHGLDSH